jgi:hypothetical protein
VKTTKPAPIGTGFVLKQFLDVEIQLELSWMWTQANIINFLLALEFDPCLDEILCKYSTLEQELVIAL